MKERSLPWIPPILKHWTRRSNFGPAGDTAGQWECPDLLELPVEGTNEKKWVLIVNRSRERQPGNGRPIFDRKIRRHNFHQRDS